MTISPAPVTVGINENDGSDVRLDLTDPRWGGTGPHCLVVGESGSGKTSFVARLATAFAQHSRVVVLGAHADAHLFPSAADFVTGRAFALLVRSLLAERTRQIEFARHAAGSSVINNAYLYRQAGGDMPPVVLVVDDVVRSCGSDSEQVAAINEAARVGGIFGVHLIMTWTWPQPLDAQRYSALEQMSTHIRLSSPGVAFGKGLMHRADDEVPFTITGASSIQYVQ